MLANHLQLVTSQHRLIDDILDFVKEALEEDIINNKENALPGKETVL